MTHVVIFHAQPPLVVHRSWTHNDMARGMAVIAYPWRRCFHVGQELGIDHRADAIGVDWHLRFWVRSQRDGRYGLPTVLAFPCGRDPVVWGWRGEGGRGQLATSTY